ncbi:MAG: hypothetical protein ACRC3Y_15260, partial [Romboutsia sp.]|uniref:hypothetical protein n=1 Tax=Romboutsia sp. TaxID=1965302 RepID=UPI003F36FBE0
MSCINSARLKFASTINVAEGFYYNNENQLSFAVSTDDLNLYVVEEQFRTNDLKNPCTGENINDLLVTVKEVRISGTLFYRLALNALVSSYNFILGSQTNVNDDGWSSDDGYVFIKSIEELNQVDYIVVGYLDPTNPIMPTREDITVVLENY